MKTVKKPGQSGQAFATAVITFFLILALAPIALVLLNSTKNTFQILKNPLAPPAKLSFDNFSHAWISANLGRGFLNSIELTGLTILIVVITSALAGYALAQGRSKMISGIKVYFIMAMTVPMQLFIYPLYYVFSKLNLINNYIAISIVLAAINLPLAVLLMRTYFLSVPKSLEEAARIDGASTLQLLMKIMLPIAMPGMITVAVIVGIYTWNEFLISSTFLQGKTNFTAILSYRTLINTAPDYGMLMAGAVILVAPIIVFFMIFQRRFVEGLTQGSVKG